MDEITRRENHLESQDDQCTDMALSRRSFVSAVGALAALPTVAGGLAMPIWADEAYAAEDDSKAAKIIVVKRNEFGIFVGDMAGNKKTPVKGATVKLVSLVNDKSVSGVSDDKGKVVLDISKISTSKKDEFGVDLYSFFAYMEVSAPGYRNYRTGRISVVGGRGIMAPTRKLDNSSVYPQMATFDDWDVLYTGNAFAVTSGNDVKHTFKIELVAKIKDPLQVSIVFDGRSNPIAKQKVTPANGVAKVEFTNYYLMSNHDSALPIGKKFSLLIEYAGHSYKADLSMVTQTSPDEATAPGSSKVTLSPFNPNKLKPQITLPSSVPVLGGKPIDVWMPTLPINFWFDPFGFVMFVARTGELGYKYKNENGKVAVDAWKYHPRKTSEEQWSEAESDRKALTQKVGKAIRGKWGLLNQVSYTDAIKATAMLQIAAAGKWRSDEAQWRMGVSMQAVLAFGTSFSQQYMVGPIPAIMEFSFMASLTVGVSAGIATTKLSDIDKYTWDYGNDGISITIVLAPCLSFGVGIKGLLSASIEGQLSFSFCVAVRAVPHDAASNVKNPHIVMGLVAQVNVVLQAFIFSKTFNLWEVGDPNLYDNWNGKPLTGQSLSPQAADVLTDFADGMQIVDDDALGAVAEFSSTGYPSTSGGSGMAGQSVDAPAFRVEELEMQTEDGVPYTCTVFTPANLAGGTPTTVVGQGGDGLNLAVGSSPELMAQEGEAQLPDEAKYDPHGSAEYKGFVEERSSKRFKGIASQSGLVPANDVCVAKGVFSDPRIKAIRVGNATHIFRISTVKVNNQSRTRVVGQVLKDGGGGAGDMTVYDFNPTIQPDNFLDVFIPGNKQVNRNDLYDYDFDVVYTSQPPNGFGLGNLIDLIEGRGAVAGMLTFFIVSGRRGQGNSTSYADAACNQLFSIVRYLVFENGSTRLVGSFGSTTSDQSFDAAGGGTSHKYHSFSCPQLHPLGTNSDNSTAGWMLTYLDRAGTTPENAVSATADGANKAKVGLGVCFIDSAGNIAAVKTNQLVSSAKAITDSSIYEMTCTASVDGGSGTAWHLVMMRGRYEVSYYLLNTVTSPSAFRESAISTVKAVTVPRSGDSSEPMRLVEWPGHKGTFLTSHGGKLQQATLSGLNGTPSLTFKDCGPTNFNVNAFGVDPSGSVIFWPACGEDNAGYSYDKVGKGTKREAKEVHQIMGARLRNGTFSDPFVYGEVEHDMHMLQVIDYLNRDSLTIVSVDMKDAKKGHADLWFTSIPLVKCANVIGCEAISPFNFPGEKALFYLTVRNDGNTYLSGFTAKLAEHGKSAESSTKLVFSQATLCESGYNPAGSGGKLSNAEPDYALAPGKTSVYQVEIEIPKGWKDEKKVSVSAAEAVMAGAGGTKAQSALFSQADDEPADDTVEEYVVGTGDNGSKDYDDELEDGTGQAPFDVMHVWGEDTYDDDAEEDYYDAPMNGVTTRNSTRGNTSAQRGTVRGTTPNTGDPAGAFGLAAAALAAASMGMVAYSKRRTELENPDES